MSLKIEKLWDVLEKSLNFPQKFLNIFESSLYKNNLFFFLKKKKCFGKKERLKAQQYANVPGDHESVFYAFQCSRHSIFSVIWSTLMGEGIAIICLCQITGKRGPWKIILAPEKCWKVLDFFPKSLYEPYTKLASWIPKCYQGVKDRKGWTSPVG